MSREWRQRILNARATQVLIWLLLSRQESLSSRPPARDEADETRGDKSGPSY